MQNNCGRFHGLDAVRAVALLLGVYLHASVSFYPLTGGWVIQDQSVSWVAYVLGFHYVHMCRMPAFFLLAGFFGRMAYHRRGPGGFVQDRLRRIAAPLICGWLVLFPLLHLEWLWGARVSGALTGEAANLPLWRTMINGWTTGAAFRDGTHFLTHLWFLYYLLQTYALTLAARPLLSRFHHAIDRVLRLVFGHPLGLLLPAIPITAALYMMGGIGVRTPDSSLLPDVPVLLTYVTLFGAGWLLHRQSDLLQIMARHPVSCLAVGLVFGTVSLVVSIVARSPSSQQLPDRAVWLVAGTYAIGMVYLTVGFVSSFIRWVDRPIPAVRYVSDAAYWVYIAHLPLVWAIQVAVAQSPLHWSIKWLLIVVVSTGLLLVSYHYLVRYTIIGRFLNGTRRFAQPRQDSEFKAKAAIAAQS